MKQETSANEVEIVSVLEAPVIISDLTGDNFTTSRFKSSINLRNVVGQDLSIPVDD